MILNAAYQSNTNPAASSHPSFATRGNWLQDSRSSRKQSKPERQGVRENLTLSTR